MKNIVICAAIEESFIKSLERLKGSDLFKDAKVHLVHCLKVAPYSYDFMTAYYPSSDMIEQYQRAIKDLLEDQKEKLLGADNESNAEFVSVVLNSDSPKESMNLYIQDHSVDLAIAITKRREGLSSVFHSSFTNYLNTHAPCDLYIIRE